MELDQALGHAIDGEALLFVGAGFSRGALNLRGTPIKSGNELAAYLSAQIGLPNDTRLDEAAEAFVTSKGEDRLITELQHEFGCQTLSDAHRVLAQVPWKRIYTTNYDNVIEEASLSAGRACRSAILSDDIRDISKHQLLCVHLNGFVSRITRESLFSEIKLTDTSYLTASLAESPWTALFRQDLELARSVFFVGYSLADLDIKRILFERPLLKEKCFFVLGRTPDDATGRSGSRFGLVLSLDTDDFAAKVEDKRRTYVPTSAPEPIYHCLQKFQAPTVPPPFSDQRIFDLLLLGDVKSQLVWASLHGGHRYFLERSPIETALQRIQLGAQAVVIHSDLGNGKSLVVEGLKCRATERGYVVYTIARRTDGLLAELQRVLTTSGEKTLLLLDDYPDWMDVVESFALSGSSSSVLVLSARSASHDVMAERLFSLLPGVVPEISVDTLGEKDVAWLVAFFDEYGLWGENASWSRSRKTDFIVTVCRRQFHAVLMKLLEAPQILSRFDQVFSQLNGKRGYYEVLVVILVLAVLDYATSVDSVVDLCGQSVLEAQFKRTPAIREFIDFDSGQVRLRSSVAAQFILMRIADPNITIDVLIKMVRAAHKLASMPFYFALFKSLMRFSNLQHLLPQEQKRQAIIRYYESIKNLDRCRSHPLFWLQYAIACLVLEEFERAGKYFQTAYSFAKDKDYDTYQIDNHFSRYLLLESIRSGDAKRCMASFRKARGLIHSEMRRERMHYPYRVATLYGDFFETFASELTPEQRGEIGRAAKFVIKRIGELPEERRQQRYVRECEETMELLVATIEKETGAAFSDASGDVS